MRSIFVISILSFLGALAHAKMFDDFLMQTLKMNKDQLYQYDYHIEMTGKEDFKELYLSELGKELFSKNIYQRKSKPIIEDKLFEQQRINVLEKSKKLKKNQQYIVQLIINDVSNLVNNKQYHSLIRYNNYPTYRLNKKIRSNLKKIHLLSKWWLFLQESEVEKIEEVFEDIVTKTSKRCHRVSRLLYVVPSDHKLKHLIKKIPTSSKKKVDKKALKTSKNKVKNHTKSSETKVKVKKAWVPRDEPSFIKYLDKFLNSKNQAKFKNQQYVAPQNMPKPANDW